jgi:hypothetical protein
MTTTDGEKSPRPTINTRVSPLCCLVNTAYICRHCNAKVCEECNANDEAEVGDEWLGYTGHTDPTCLTYPVGEVNKGFWINLRYEAQRKENERKIKELKERREEK